MGRLIAAVYDWSTQASEMACLRQWRTELLRQLVGHVLEVGAGTGLNIPYYPPTVAPLVLSEPDPHVRRRLSQRARAEHGQQAQILDASLEGLSLPNDSFDAVVGTLVLCSVPRLDRALAEIFRVRKPGGRFVFLEHVAAEDRPRRLRWQHRLEPFWRAVSGNCHLARRTDDAIIAAGFRIVDFKRESVRKAWLRRYGPACLSLGHSSAFLFPPV